MERYFKLLEMSHKEVAIFYYDTGVTTSRVEAAKRGLDSTPYQLYTINKKYTLEDAFRDYKGNYILHQANSDQALELDRLIEASHRNVFFIATSASSSNIENLKHGISLSSNDSLLVPLLIALWSSMTLDAIVVYHSNMTYALSLLNDISKINRYPKLSNVSILVNPLSVPNGRSVGLILSTNHEFITKTLDNNLSFFMIHDVAAYKYEGNKSVLTINPNAYNVSLTCLAQTNPVLDLVPFNTASCAAYDAGKLLSRIIELGIRRHYTDVLASWNLLLNNESWALIAGNELQNHMMKYSRYDCMYVNQKFNIIPEFYETWRGDILRLLYSTSKMNSMVNGKLNINIYPEVLTTYIDGNKRYQKYSSSIIETQDIYINRSRTERGVIRKKNDIRMIGNWEAYENTIIIDDIG